jgi:hypothetical protein
MLLSYLPAQCHRPLLDQLQQIAAFTHQQVCGIGDVGEVFVAGGDEAHTRHGFQQVAGRLKALIGAGLQVVEAGVGADDQDGDCGEVGAERDVTILSVHRYAL